MMEENFVLLFDLNYYQHQDEFFYFRKKQNLDLKKKIN